MNSEEVIIRRADAGDIDSIAELEALCFSDPWSREAVASEFSGRNPSLYFAAELSGRVIGYAGVWTVPPEAYITNVAVHPDFRRLHIGSKIIERLIAECCAAGAPEITLEVRVSNAPAIKLYESFGFVTAGVRAKYYSDGEDAFIMWRRPEEEE